jgi:hypothetical protein
MTLGKFDISAHINMGHVVLSDEFLISKLSYPNLYNWNGQSHLTEGNGMGRN